MRVCSGVWNLVRGFEAVQGHSKECEGMRGCARVFNQFKGMQGCVWVCKDVWKCVKVCEYVWGHARESKACQIVWGCARVCQGVWVCARACECMQGCRGVNKAIQACVKSYEAVQSGGECANAWQKVPKIKSVRLESDCPQANMPNKNNSWQISWNQWL